jgi:integrase
VKKEMEKTRYPGVYLRGKSYCYVFDAGPDPATGKRRQATKGGFRTAKEASTARTTAMTDAARHGYNKPVKVTFGDFADEWQAAYALKHAAKPNTFMTGGYLVARLKKEIGGLLVEKITARDCQELALRVYARYKRGSAQKIVAHLKMILDSAVKFGVIASSPARDIEHPPEAEVFEMPLPNYMEKDELAKLLIFVKEHGTLSEYALFLLLAYSGLRIGEALALTSEQINFGTGEITVNRNLCSLKGCYHIGTPKTRSSRRVLDMDGAVLAVLQRLIQQNKVAKMRWRDTWTCEEDFLFVRPQTGEPISRSQASYKLDVFLNLSGTQAHYSLHSLRHTHCSLLSEAGAGLEEIQARLGHGKDSATTSIYLHVTKARRQRTAEKFSVLMEDANEMLTKKPKTR